MAIFFKKFLVDDKPARIKTKNFGSKVEQHHKVKHHPILTDSTLDLIRDHPRFSKENFYSLDLTHINTYLNKILKDQDRYEDFIDKADLRLAIAITTKFIRIYYLSKHTFVIKLNRFKISLHIIYLGEVIFKGELSIKQDELISILKNA